MISTYGRTEPYAVLLVEDNPADAELVLHSLRKFGDIGFRVEHVEHLAAALTSLAQCGVDVALIDLSLPDSQGIATFHAIHSAAPGMPIVVLTGMDDEHIVLEILRQGAQDYLLKQDVESKLLARSLRFAIERQRTAALESCVAELGAARILLEKKNRRLTKLYNTAHEFVDNVSHEFRTPLTVIKEYVSLLKDGLVGPVSGEQKQMLTVVEDRADDLNTMVDDMLDVSKLESGLLVVYRRNCNVQDIVAHVWRGLERKAAVKGVQLVCEIDEHLPEVFCDPEKAGRVLINLVTNALKFCGKPGAVRLRCQEEPKVAGVKLSITDNGRGIDPENQRAIFRRFEQLGDPLHSSTKGFGLGLNIAKELVELNLGHITLQSQLGSGSTFSFTLPRADPLEVMSRYLTRIEYLRDGSPQITLLQVDVAESVSDAMVEDVNVFLSCLLCATDLLFHIRPTTWLIVLPVAETEITAFRERVEREFIASNRNRIGKPLPTFGLTVIGGWLVSQEQEHILASLSQAIGVSEYAHG